MKIVMVSVAIGGTMITAPPPRSARIPVATSHLRACLTSLPNRRSASNQAVIVGADGTPEWEKRSVQGGAIARCLL